MSSLGLVVLRSPLGAQVLQESVNNIVNISNNEKPKEVILVRKKKIQPNTVSVTSLVAAAENSVPASSVVLPPRSKRPRIREDDEGRPPAPLAVARRNARERNRVRQVNNGFAALRKHIPDEVAEAFESTSSRGPNKKLSKVETLRMAVEYIRNLETLLEIGTDKENSKQNDTFPSPVSSSPRDNSFERSYFSMHSPEYDEDDDEETGRITAEPALPLQYARLPSDAIPAHLYEEDDNQPATPSSDFIADDLMSPHFDTSFLAAEQFTVIEPEFGGEEDCDGFEEEDVKYADVLADEGLLGLHTVDPQLILPAPQYVISRDTRAEPKREVPVTHVSPEDRQQFEETLRWWQEKTRGARPVLVNRDKR